MTISVPACFRDFDGLPIDVLRRIRAGLPASLVEDVSAFLGIRLEMLTDYLALSESDVRRRIEAGEFLESWESSRLFLVSQAYFEAVAVLESEQGSVEWLRGRVPALGNVTPLSFLDTPPGYQLVVTTLGQIKYGVYA